MNCNSGKEAFQKSKRPFNVMPLNLKLEAIGI